MSHLEISTGADLKTVVKLDGHDITNGLRGYQITHEAPGKQPLVMLHPAVFEFVEGDVEGRVYIAPAAADLLIGLGWTPPGGAA
jgi:hypothetical protein